MRVDVASALSFTVTNLHHLELSGYLVLLCYTIIIFISLGRIPYAIQIHKRGYIYSYYHRGPMHNVTHAGHSL